jgi:hypothetical protein
MTAINLPGQLELATVVDHQVGLNIPTEDEIAAGNIYMARQIAKLLVQYEDRPTSETWALIQRLAAEILK